MDGTGRRARRKGKKGGGGSGRVSGTVAPFYAVHVGRKPGIYRDWPSCDAQVKGFSGAVFRRFTDPLSAAHYVTHGETTKSDPVPAPAAPATPAPPEKPELVFAPGTPDYDPNEEALVVYVDGSVRKSDESSVMLAGYSLYFGENHLFNQSRRYPFPNPTSFKCLVMGVFSALDLVVRWASVPDNDGAPFGGAEELPMPSDRLVVLVFNVPDFVDAVRTQWEEWARNDFCKPNGRPLEARKTLQSLARLFRQHPVALAYEQLREVPVDEVAEHAEDLRAAIAPEPAMTETTSDPAPWAHAFVGTTDFEVSLRG